MEGLVRTVNYLKYLETKLAGYGINRKVCYLMHLGTARYDQFLECRADIVKNVLNVLSFLANFFLTDYAILTLKYTKDVIAKVYTLIKMQVYISLLIFASTIVRPNSANF